uniref:Uncharacterized protein n=1 Tax=Arundo donax TaxID=35708 RepID=A0A0A9HGG8_ARUDO
MTTSKNGLAHNVKTSVYLLV